LKIGLQWFKISIDGGTIQISFKSLCEEDNDVLCKVIIEQEIVEVVRQCGSTKSLGLDGYNFHFIKNNWEVVGLYIINAVLYFQEFGFIPRECNASFITLIPKRESPFSLNDYRPILLVRYMYKIISKILANRLKSVLPMVIDSHQYAFFTGRGLLDSVLITNETVDYMRKEKRKVLLLRWILKKCTIQ